MSEPLLYVNHYEHCGRKWDDSLSCIGLSDCPSCNNAIWPSSYEATELLKDAEVLLGTLADAQTKMWDAARELEDLLDIEIDTTDDMEDATIQSLLEDKE
jgi:hypothetical protein